MARSGERILSSLYLLAELETYSVQTLASLLEDVRGKQSAGVNMSEKVYQHLFRKLGYGSIRVAEQSLQNPDLQAQSE
jgi:hypothetical protein